MKAEPEFTELAKKHIEEFASLMLWRSGAIQTNTDKPFRLASGNYSPLYINCRQVISDPVFMDLVCAFSHAVLTWNGVRTDVIAGGETAGIPFAAYIAHTLALPMVYIRKKTKEHGVASLVEGAFGQGATVLLVEDLITDAASKLHFIAGIQAAGGTVNHTLVLFDREQGGRESLKDHGISLHALTRLSVALRVGSETGILTRAQQDSLSEYLEGVEAWHRKRSLPFRQ